MPGHEPDFETDRARFLGRGASRRSPHALDGARLSRTVGNVLDPSVSLRRTITLEPGRLEVTLLVLGAGPDRDGALALVDGLPDVTDAFESARRHERGLLDRLGLADEEAAHLQAFAGAVLYRDPEAVAMPQLHAARGYWDAMGIRAHLPASHGGEAR
jgi:cyclic beta-1,2-glucan synthetase